MKPLFASLISVAALAACETTMSASGSSGRIMTEEEFRGTVVGRSLTAGDSTLMAGADGTISGTAPNGRVTGRWNWQDGYFCRTASVGGTALAPDCQTVSVDGSSATITREQGRGQAITYTLG